MNKTLELRDIIKLEDRYGATVGGPGGLRVRRGTKAFISNVTNKVKRSVSRRTRVAKSAKKR